MYFMPMFNIDLSWLIAFYTIPNFSIITFMKRFKTESQLDEVAYYAIILKKLLGQCN